MKLYTIRYYNKSDRPRLIQFLDKHWRKNHIVATSEVVFDFQYKYDDRYTFVVAENKETGEFDGVYGYILTHKYDKSHQIPNIAWGAIWKVRNDVKNAEIESLGLGLLRFIIQHEDIDTFAASGISDINKQIVKGLGFNVEELTHYYIANNKYDTFSIAENPVICDAEKNNCHLSWIEWSEDIPIKNSLNQYKNYNYFVHRYKEHPVYKYKMLGVFTGEELKVIFIVRKQNVGDSSCLRIVDIIGTNQGIKNIGQDIQMILRKERAEYIDCWNAGVPSIFFQNLGFVEVNGDTIIPDYFAPFEKRNVKIEYECMDPECKLIVCKGDGDQDRPNSEIVEEW